MRKRILSLVLVFVLICTMSLSVSAASASKTGKTSGGTEGTLNTRAELYVYTDHATATTWCGSGSGSVRKTTVTFNYLNSNNQTSSLSVAGSSTVTAYPGNSANMPTGISGTSQHSVTSEDGEWGSWSCSLSANVW